MEDKQATKILMELLKKPGISAEEQEAIKSALGLFSWTSLGASRVKKLKDKQAKNTKWA